VGSPISTHNEALGSLTFLLLLYIHASGCQPPSGIPAVAPSTCELCLQSQGPHLLAMAKFFSGKEVILGLSFSPHCLLALKVCSAG